LLVSTAIQCGIGLDIGGYVARLSWCAVRQSSAYGIHGTPEPAFIDKVESHGCVRLTNWDVEELADMVRPGVIVDFVNRRSRVSK
jgi:lipoprotein-anchoring transpeptidase ErfK/SrfK